MIFCRIFGEGVCLLDVSVWVGLKFSCVELASTSPFSLIGRRREAEGVFDIRASYVSYSFVVVSCLKDRRGR